MMEMLSKKKMVNKSRARDNERAWQPRLALANTFERNLCTLRAVSIVTPYRKTTNNISISQHHLSYIYNDDLFINVCTFWLADIYPSDRFQSTAFFSLSVCYTNRICLTHFPGFYLDCLFCSVVIVFVVCYCCVWSFYFLPIQSDIIILLSFLHRLNLS